MAESITDNLATYLQTAPVVDSGEFATVSKDTMTSGLEDMPDRLLQRYQDKHYALIADIEHIGLPQPNEQFRLVTRRNFNAVQFIDYIAQRETISDCRLVVYSINHNAAMIFYNLIESGKIHTAEVLVSNLRNKAHREKEEIIKNLFRNHPRIKLFYCSSHAKVFSCRTECGNFYTIEGSGNMSYNSRVEQYVIDNDRELFEFTKNWMEEIKQYLANKKELELCEVDHD